jgi:hypothetical protein
MTIILKSQKPLKNLKSTRNKNRSKTWKPTLGFLMIIILSDDYLYQTFSPLRKKNDKYMFFFFKI